MNRLPQAAALCALSLSVLATAEAATAAAPPPDRAQELVRPQLLPSTPRPAQPARPGGQLGKAAARTGDPVPEAPEDAAAAKAEAAQGSEAAAYIPYYYAITGNSSIALPSRSNYVCAMHKLQGIMQDDAVVRVRYFDNNTQEIGQSGGNAAFSSMAACVNKYMFFNNSQNPISKVFDTKYQFVANGSTWYPEEWGNAAAMMTGIGARFRSLADRVWVWQEAPTAQNWVDIVSTNETHIVGYSTAFWFNESAGPQKAIKFIGPGGTGSAALAGEYFAGRDGVGSQAVSMAKSGESFCYLTGVNGGLSNYADRVEIKVHPTTNRYVLEVSKSNGEALHAYARCMAFDQR